MGAVNLAGEVVKEEPPLIKARVVLYAMAPECNCSTGKIIEGEFFEFGFIEILVVLGMRMQTYELSDIDCLAGIVVEDKFNAEIPGASGRCDFQSAHFIIYTSSQSECSNRLEKFIRMFRLLLLFFRGRRNILGCHLKLEGIFSGKDRRFSDRFCHSFLYFPRTLDLQNKL